MSIGAKRERGPVPPSELRTLLEKLGVPPWPVFFDAEARYGGIAGVGSDDRELWIGARHRAYGAKRTLDGRPHCVLAAFSPILWYADEAGRIVEIDDLGERFYESDSIEHRIEQLALFDAGDSERLDGRRGEEIAAILELEPVPEAADSRNRYWARGGSAYEHGKGVLLWECFTPSDYGKKDLVWSTWIMARAKRDLAAARKKIGR